MTNQEAFNKVVIGLRAQGRPSINPNSVCMYRNSEGLKCAVGILIPDEEYRPEFDCNLDLINVIEQVPALQSFDRIFLNSLQYVHDSASFNTEVGGFMQDLEEGFQKIAKVYHLTIPQKV
jgi:hypothetical protein